jgi:hypothetical protein
MFQLQNEVKKMIMTTKIEIWKHATDWTIGVRFPAGGVRIFLFDITSREDLGSTQYPLGSGGSVSGSGRGVKLTTPLNFVPRSKNACCASTPQYAFMARCLVKHRDNFTILALLRHYLAFA